MAVGRERAHGNCLSRAEAPANKMWAFAAAELELGTRRREMNMYNRGSRASKSNHRQTKPPPLNVNARLAREVDIEQASDSK